MNSKTLNKLVEFCRADINSITHNFKHFSFILDKNKILSIGRNNPDKTHPLSYKYGYRFSCIHSELNVLVNFRYPHSYLQKCKLVNIRINSRAELRMSKPCNICVGLISAFGISEIIYSNRQGGFNVL